MDHSVWGYLNRRSNEELLLILENCKKDDGYREYLPLIEEILKNRKEQSGNSANVIGEKWVDI